MPPTVGVLTLARADIRSLARNNFGLGVAAVLTGLLAPLMAFALYGPAAMRDVLMFLCVVAELVVGILLAARIASSRSTRFVESLYTTPLEAHTWLAAQALVGLFLGALVIAVHLPFIALYSALVGPPHMVGPVLAAAAAMAVCSVALGLFFGVVVGQAGPGAAAGLAGGFAFASFFGLILHGIAADPGPLSGMDAFLVRVTAISPLALAVDAAGIDIFRLAVTDWWRPVLGLTVFTLGLGAAAWFSYVRLQSPLGWEPRRGRLAVVALVAVALLVPVATAAVTFREVDAPRSFVLEPGDHTRVAFVRPGEPITDEQFTLRSLLTWSSLVHGRDNQLDALVMLVVPPDTVVRGVTIQVTGSPDIAVVAGGGRTIPDGRPDGEARMHNALEGVSENGTLRPVYRVPVTVRPLQADALLESPGLVEVRTTFQADGRTLGSHDRVTLHATVPGASVAMLAAGAPVPLLALGAAVNRRIRTR